MRNETEMLELIVKTANEDDRIRAVYMSGSRVNCNVPNDALADYDIVYVVKDTKPFYEDSHYMERFGEILYMQEPDRLDASVGKKLDFNEKYTWLVIYTDGNRIDLTVCNEKKADITGDRVYRVLLDKDGRFANAPVSDDRARWVKKPSEAEYAAVCNEFWWCINNVVKGIKRYEITYAQDMMNYYVRPMLLKMLSWKVGILTDFSVSVGKSGKYMNKWLLDDDYEMLLETYSGGLAGEMYHALKVMADLFDKIGLFVGDKLGYEYNERDSKAARIYMDMVRKMKL
ncbi:MAG: aminoglycoside 6-adenylyltransferase [Lachnospiraceae bacterium]|nr:aminoglycoside 6-adenylyltransferase [Lachnoclostridium sp.]MDD7521053.1 aminoglycoside 6-adenylyltransferase [Lachnoclostridium sp.]MDY2598645.1 aminoglycoside 6-adenylyltransferase [Lachnospiraceae bacterium]